MASYLSSLGTLSYGLIHPNLPIIPYMKRALVFSWKLSLSLSEGFTPLWPFVPGHSLQAFPNLCLATPAPVPHPPLPSRAPS